MQSEKTASNRSEGVLYVVGTPIGNLEDITLRALRILREVDLIAAEDTRVTLKLLAHYDIHTPITSYHQHSKGRKAEYLVSRMQEGKKIALVSDAGMPGISDPGHDLIRLTIEAGLPVIPVPGPTAAITALVVSGLPTTHFCFDGFLPRKANERKNTLASLLQERRTILLYESPQRLRQTLQDILNVLGDREIAIAEEVTKFFEKTFRGTVSQALAHFSLVRLRGEYTLVLAGRTDLERGGEATAQEIADMLQALRQAGKTEKEAIRETSVVLKVPKRDVYRIALQQKSAAKTGFQGSGSHVQDALLDFSDRYST